MTVVLPFKVRSAIVTTFHVLATSATVFRLHHRHRRQHLGWDDCWVLVGLFFDIAFFTSMWLQYHGLGLVPVSERPRHIAGYWIMSISYPSAIWSERMSIGASILRFVPKGTRTRKLLHAVLILFGVIWAGLELPTIWLDASTTAWHYERRSCLLLGQAVGATSVASDVVADILLITIPYSVLRRTKLPGTQQRVILSIFASSIFSTLVTIVCAFFYFSTSMLGPYCGAWLDLALQLNTTVTLFVCNLLVIVPCIYRLLRRREDDTASESESSSSDDLPTRTLPMSSAERVSLTEVSGMQSFGAMRGDVPGMTSTFITRTYVTSSRD